VELERGMGENNGKEIEGKGREGTENENKERKVGSAYMTDFKLGSPASGFRSASAHTMLYS